jgi:hypothetical protein
VFGEGGAPVNDEHLIFLWQRYADQKSGRNGVVRDDLPYSANLDLIRAQLNVYFGTNYTHSEVYQAISHLARHPTRLGDFGLPRDGDIRLGPQK